MSNIKTIAFYLPQYHPIPENDEWWGQGFTEWTNVTKAKPLFKKHHQPLLPKDLGFYDLRVPEVRTKQAELAQHAGISAFAYWHYWFGNGKKLLERPLKEVLINKEPNFPFCLAWANETWSGRWHGLANKILIEQLYPGIEDQKAFFYDSLPYFLDERYFKLNKKVVFIIYKPFDIPNIKAFLENWRNLGSKESISFHLIGVGDHNCLELGFDGYVSHGPVVPKTIIQRSRLKQIIKKIELIGIKDFLFNKNLPQIFDHREIVRNMLNNPIGEFEYPLIIPNWDNTPRSGKRGLVFQNSGPELFKESLEAACKKLSERSNDRLLFIKSWNEWAEGNILEPSERWGMSYILASRTVFDKYK